MATITEEQNSLRLAQARRRLRPYGEIPLQEFSSQDEQTETSAMEKRRFVQAEFAEQQQTAMLEWQQTEEKRQQLASLQLTQARRAPPRHLRDILSINQLVARAAEKLNERIARGQDFSTFMFVILIAGIKDAADIYTLSVAGVVLIFINLFLMYFLFRKGWFLRTKARILARVALWVASMIFDNVPGIGLMPMTTIMVLLAWRNVRQDAARAEVDLPELETKTEEELRELAEEGSGETSDLEFAGTIQ